MNNHLFISMNSPVIKEFPWNETLTQLLLGYVSFSNWLDDTLLDISL